MATNQGVVGSNPAGRATFQNATFGWHLHFCLSPEQANCLACVQDLKGIGHARSTARSRRAGVAGRDHSLPGAPHFKMPPSGGICISRSAPPLARAGFGGIRCSGFRLARREAKQLASRNPALALPGAPHFKMPPSGGICISRSAPPRKQEQDLAESDAADSGLRGQPPSKKGPLKQAPLASGNPSSEGYFSSPSKNDHCKAWRYASCWLFAEAEWPPSMFS